MVAYRWQKSGGAMFAAQRRLRLDPVAGLAAPGGALVAWAEELRNGMNLSVG
jgi:hypothetical protein